MFDTLNADATPGWSCLFLNPSVTLRRIEVKKEAMTKDDKIELMVPAGSFEALQAAIDNGADSVYFGVTQLNMRARSSINFTLEDLKEIARRTNEAGVRSYLTLNTIIYDHDLSLIKTILNTAKEAGITAVIGADQSVMSYAREIGLELHISTQVNITNAQTVKFYSLFADTMVMSRELSLSQVKKIVETIEKEEIRGPSGRLIEIEIFGHGALCMAVSGKCYLSLHSYNSSANRGACKQNCRKQYVVTDKETGFEIEIDNEYMMSPKDLCTIGFLDQIVDAGVKVLKIEGRGRAPEYVAKTTKCYREAIDAIGDGSYSAAMVEGWMEELKKVYNRGFWDGYYLGQKLGEWSDTSGSQATQKKVYIGKGKGFYSKVSVGEFAIEAYDVSIGDTVLVTGPTTGVEQFEVSALRLDDGTDVEKASKGHLITMPLDFKLRPSDKLYKIVGTEWS